MKHALSRRNVCVLLLGLVPAVGAAAPALAADPPLAIRGYDPVSYFTSGKPERGLAEFELEWDEHRYRFAQPEHREMFKADPLRYAPQFANFCAVALARGEVYEGQPEHWLISDGKLYLFAKASGIELFRRNLPQNISKAADNGWMVNQR